MYVRKFEADTIEEALRDIKRELGPDAVILKTLTNKGLKGAFKKKKSRNYGRYFREELREESFCGYDFKR